MLWHFLLSPDQDTRELVRYHFVREKKLSSWLWSRWKNVWLSLFFAFVNEGSHQVDFRHEWTMTSPWCFFRSWYVLPVSRHLCVRSWCKIFQTCTTGWLTSSSPVSVLKTFLHVFLPCCDGIRPETEAFVSGIMMWLQQQTRSLRTTTMQSYL